MPAPFGRANRAHWSAFPGFGLKPVIPAKIAKTEAMLADAAARRFPDAMLELATGRLAGRYGPHNPEPSLDMLRALANLGNPKAMFALADVLFAGRGMVPDHAEGFAWAMRAAAAGVPRADIIIAQALLDGKGTPQDVGAAGGACERA